MKPTLKIHTRVFLGNMMLLFYTLMTIPCFYWVSTHTDLKMLIKKLNFMLVGLHEFMVVIKFINTIEIRCTHTRSIGISQITFFTQSSSSKTPSNALWSQGILETIESMLITLVGWVLMCREGKSLQLCIWWSHRYFILTHPTIAKALLSPILLIPKTGCIFTIVWADKNPINICKHYKMLQTQLKTINVFFKT